MRIIVALLLTVFFNFAFAQTPELVIDFNPGSEGSRAYLDAAYLGDDIIMTIRNEDVGDEVALLKDGTISVLKDINSGPEDGDPRSHVNFNSQVYFSAFDEANGYAIWRTDGTPEGTVMDFDPGTSSANIRAMIVADNGNLYYNYDGKIFRCDGATHTEVFDGANLGFVFQQAAFNYSKYQNGIAFIVRNSNDSFTLYHIDDDEAVQLATTIEYDFFTDGYGVVPVVGGLTFNVADDGADDVLYYDEVAGTLSTVPIGGSASAAIRLFDTQEGSAIGYFANKGYYRYGGGEEPEKLYDVESIGLSQGQQLVAATRQGKAAFVADEGVFGDAYLVYTDGTSAGTNELREVQPYQSNMIQYGRYGFFADGTSNLFDPKIFQVDMEEGTVELVYSYNQSSNNTNSVRPLGVQDGFLYYFSNLDTDVGEELYRIELDIVSSTQPSLVSEQSYMITQQAEQITIAAPDENVKVNIVDSSGRLIVSTEVRTNTAFVPSLGVGIYYLTVSGGLGTTTKPIVVAN